MPTWSTLHDVAFLYLFLASDTDRDLEVSELEAIILRLHEKMPEWSIPDLRAVVDEAAEEARTGAHGHTVRSVTESLKYAQFDDEQRRILLDDLLQIARADGTVHKNEIAFIRALSRVWQIDPPEKSPEALYHLALIFLYMAHGTDGQLEHPELDRVLAELQHWRPDYTPVMIHGLVKDALVHLQETDGPDRVTHAIQAIKEAMPLGKQRQELLEATLRIARADGVVTAGQRNFLQELAEAFEMENWPPAESLPE